MAIGLMALLAACPASSGTPTYSYVCPNGTPEEGSTTTSEEVNCAACDAGYTLTGQACNRTLRGDDAANTLIGTSMNDFIDGRGGDDTISGLGGDDVLVGGPGADSLNGGAGSDWASYSTASAAVTVNLATPSANSGDANGDSYSSIENLRGSPYHDTLSGNSANNILEGLAGADTFRFGGSFGLDSIGTGANADIATSDSLEFSDRAALSYSYSATDVSITQGSNRVTIYSANVASGAQNVGARQESLVDFRLQQGTTTYNVVVGTTGSDGVLHTTNPALTTTLYGGSGADLILGLDDDDQLYGEEGADELWGGAGVDEIQGDEDNDRLIGGAGIDILYGGGKTNDLDSGGRDDNAQGSDTFLFEAGFGGDFIGFFLAPTSFRIGIDASDILEFTDNSPLMLAWIDQSGIGANPSDGISNDLRITQGSNSVTIIFATDATSDGGFRIMWNGITERVDSTTDLVVDGN